MFAVNTVFDITISSRKLVKKLCLAINLDFTTRTMLSREQYHKTHSYAGFVQPGSLEQGSLLRRRSFGSSRNGGEIA